jgi:hypothetical protein
MAEIRDANKILASKVEKEREAAILRATHQNTITYFYCK